MTNTLTVFLTTHVGIKHVVDEAEGGLYGIGKIQYVCGSQNNDYLIEMAATLSLTYL